MIMSLLLGWLLKKAARVRRRVQPFGVSQARPLLAERCFDAVVLVQTGGLDRFGGEVTRHGTAEQGDADQHQEDRGFHGCLLSWNTVAATIS